MQFWNNKEGIAMGDPIADCLNVIITRDGEIHGVKVPSNKLPKVMDGEAALRQAYNILIKGNNTWFVSWKKSRVFIQTRETSWTVLTTQLFKEKR
jgi:hypothetical protein